MKVYMFQKVEDFYELCESYTHEELFYKYEDAVKYLEEEYELYIDYVDKNYCLEGEIVDDVCEIIHHSEDYRTVYMEDLFYASFRIYEKTIMSFN